MSPPCESFLAADQLDRGETFYPLHVRICSECLLVQLPAYIAAEDIFTHYAYFSSFSDSWVAHAGRYVGAAVERLGLGADSFVVEVASNDGYLLQHVVARGIRALGIEPAANVAEAAVAKGVPTEVLFLGEETGAEVAAEHGPADLVVANNVFAHVPDIVDFAKGLRALVADDGRVTIEIPHLLRLIEGREYDTIYHEHYSYLSLLTTQRVLARSGADGRRRRGAAHPRRLAAHVVGARPSRRRRSVARRSPRCWPPRPRPGSTRSRATPGSRPRWPRCATTWSSSWWPGRARARSSPATGRPGRATRCSTTRASGPTCWPSRSTATRSSTASSCPGTHIPIFDVDEIAARKPDFVVILPWNLRAEISAQLAYVRDWGGRLVVPLPRLEVLP